MARTTAWWRRLLPSRRSRSEPASDPARPAKPSTRLSYFHSRRLAGKAADTRAATTTTIDPWELAAGFTLEQREEDSTWRNLDLARAPYDKVSPARMLEILTDASPEVSRGLWDFLRFCNPGWEVVATKVDSDVEVPAGTRALRAFLKQLQELHGSADVVLGKLFIGAWMRGGFFGELVLGKNKRDAVDLATPDPATVRFLTVNDPVRGPIWQLGQQQGYKTVQLDRPTVRYIPIDPLPGSPYGRSPAHPALFGTVFLLSLLHDIKRVVSQQGYPRLDLEINLEEVLKTMPEDIVGDPDAVTEWVQRVVDAIADTYEGLEPDDAYVHTSVVKVNRPVGAVDAGSLGALNGLITALERMSVRALKTMPLLMGITDGVSEANANRQWEIHVAGIKSLQHLAESLMEQLLNQLLQAQGIAATAKFRFAELRAAEMLRDEQVRTIKLTNTLMEYQSGWISQEEAAQKAVGHKPDVEAPRDQLEREATAKREEAAARAAARAEAKRQEAAAKAAADAASNPDTPTPGNQEDGGDATTGTEPTANTADSADRQRMIQLLDELRAERRQLIALLEREGRR